MKQIFTEKRGSDRLLILFAGWGSDQNIFGNFQKDGYDTLICFDYNDLSFDYSAVEGYGHIEVIGWSFGVWVASQIAENIDVAHSVAINGTPHPIDDNYGIPEAIFEGTLSTFSASTLSKFRRRMCGSSSGVREFLALEPCRSIESLHSELSALKSAYLESKKSKFKWSRAVVGLQDMIVPTANQLRYWSENSIEIVEVDEPHFSVSLFKAI